MCWLRQHASWRRLALCYALGAGGVGALRAWAPAAARSPRLRLALDALGAPKGMDGGAARPGAYPPTCVPPPDNLRALPLGGGDVVDVVRSALLETLGA